jgi:hypothetical protein
VDTPSLGRNITIILLRALLILTLIGVGWILYHRLPTSKTEKGLKEPGETVLKIVLRKSPDVSDLESLTIPVELYPLDVSAVQREFLSERRPGQRFEEFLADRMNMQAPKAELGKDGETIIKVKPGKWWVHAILSGTQELVWRLPVNVSGREQIVELTPENIYTKTKKF